MTPFSTRLDPAVPRARRVSVAMRLCRLIPACSVYLGATDGEELARNLAGCDAEDVTLAAVGEAIERRRAHFGVVLSDETAARCAVHVHEAWHA